MRFAVLFDIDGLTLRRVGACGNVERQTPLLDEFAAQANVFEQYFLAVPDHPLRGGRVAAAAGGGIDTVEIACASDATTDEGAILVPSADCLGETLQGVLDSRESASRTARDTIVWVRLSPGDGAVDDVLPMSLIVALIEAGVGVGVTTRNPLPDADELAVIENEEWIHVPLMVWSGEPQRQQVILSSVDLGSVVFDADENEAAAPNPAAVIRTQVSAGLREPATFLVAARSLLEELSGVSDSDLANHVDATSKRLCWFRKPEDVWNVHNALVEDHARAIAALARLRRLLKNAT